MSGLVAMGPDAVVCVEGAPTAHILIDRRAGERWASLPLQRSEVAVANVVGLGRTVVGESHVEGVGRTVRGFGLVPHDLGHLVELAALPGTVHAQCACGSVLSIG